MVRISFILLLMMSYLHSDAQLVRQILVDVDSNFSSFPGYLTSFRGKLVFFAIGSKATGRELYALDSGDTAAKLVHDIYPGKNGSDRQDNITMAVVNNVLYFGADNGTDGYELYSWNGVDTPKLEYDFNPGAASGVSPSDIIVLQGKIYLAATNGIEGRELWEYDPAQKSARRLTDLNPGAGPSHPDRFAVHDGKLYFLAFAPLTYTQLYVYDPKTDDTKLVSDIYPDVDCSDASCLTVLDSTLYFSAKSDTYKRELYHIKNDVLERLTDINTQIGGNSSYVFSDSKPLLVKVGNTIYMPAKPDDTTNALYKYDPASKTASLVYRGDVTVGELISYANAIFFSGFTMAVGNELFRYDTLNTAPPYHVADIYPGRTYNFKNAENLYVHNDRLYFTGWGPILPAPMHLYEYTDTTFTKVPPNSIKNVTAVPHCKAYPNPFSSELIIEIALQRDEKFYIRLTDITGAVVYKTDIKKLNPADNKVVIPTHELSAGAYFYAIVNEVGTILQSGKILRQ